jgi:hypothetical protein
VEALGGAIRQPGTSEQALKRAKKIMMAKPAERAILAEVQADLMLRPYRRRLGAGSAWFRYHGTRFVPSRGRKATNRYEADRLIKEVYRHTPNERVGSKKGSTCAHHHMGEAQERSCRRRMAHGLPFRSYMQPEGKCAGKRFVILVVESRSLVRLVYPSTLPGSPGEVVRARSTEFIYGAPGGP